MIVVREITRIPRVQLENTIPTGSSGYTVARNRFEHFRKQGDDIARKRHFHQPNNPTPNQPRPEHVANLLQ